MRDGLAVLAGAAALLACCALFPLGIAVIGGVGIAAQFEIATAALALLVAVIAIILRQQQTSSPRKAKR